MEDNTHRIKSNSPPIPTYFGDNVPSDFEGIPKGLTHINTKDELCEWVQGTKIGYWIPVQYLERI